MYCLFCILLHYYLHWGSCHNFYGIILLTSKILNVKINLIFFFPRLYKPFYISSIAFRFFVAPVALSFCDVCFFCYSHYLMLLGICIYVTGCWEIGSLLLKYNSICQWMESQTTDGAELDLFQLEFLSSPPLELVQPMFPETSFPASHTA